MLPRINQLSERDQLLRSPSTTTPWRLEFLEGPNAGAVLFLQTGRHRLGRTDGNDILLADSRVADQQAEIQVEQDGRRATIRALSHGVLLGRWQVQVGAPAVALRNGAVFCVGVTRIRAVQRPDATADMVRHRIPALRAAALAPIALILVLGAAWAATYRIPVPPQAAADVSPEALADTAFAASATAIHPIPQSRRPTVEIAAEALRNYIDTIPSLRSQDGKGIQISAEAGAIIAAGAVADRQAWSKAQAWFDATYTGHLALVDRTVGNLPQTDEPPVLQLRAVSVGAIPYLILADGSRLTEGAVLRSGWIVERITMDRVILRRHRSGSGGDERIVEIGL